MIDVKNVKINMRTNLNSMIFDCFVMIVINSMKIFVHIINKFIYRTKKFDVLFERNEMISFRFQQLHNRKQI